MLMLEASPSVPGVISVAPLVTASLVGSDVVASALARAMAQQVGVSASDIEIAVTAMSDGEVVLRRIRRFLGLRSHR